MARFSVKKSINRLVEPGKVRPFRKRSYAPKNKPAITGKLAVAARGSAHDPTSD